MTPTPPTHSSETATWLVRIPEIFSGIADPVLERLGTEGRATRLGRDYYLFRSRTPEAVLSSEAACLVRWRLPVGHAWPCHPAKMENFLEKAAQGLAAKFAGHPLQGLFVGALHPTSPDPYHRRLASNLRGRLLTLFPKLPASRPEEQDPVLPTLFCLVGREGLYAGVQSPRLANGFHPGGSRYIDRDGPGTISRAGAKIAEALHYLRLHRIPPPPGSAWLELGACPGGMTSELLARGYRVTAIDRASLDPRLGKRPGLTFVLEDVAAFSPPPGTRFDALLCDMNGPASASIAETLRLSRFVKAGGPVVFTLKLPRVTSVEEPVALLRSTARSAEGAGLRLFATTHLTYNRHELTLFFENRARI